MRKLSDCLFAKLPAGHSITQSMSLKGNYMNNDASEKFFGRLKVEMFYGGILKVLNLSLMN